jgi:hypothetical protein
MVAALGEAAASEPRARSHSGILVLLWMLLLGGAGAACAPDRVLLLTVLDIPAEVTTLRISALVEGKLLQEPVEVSAQEKALRLPLPATAHGRVTVEVQALDAQSCVPLQGVAGAPLQAVGLTQVDVFLRPLSTKTCPLTVRGVEPKLLRVVSSGDELDCGSRCEAQVALGTRLTLTAQPLDGGHFVGFTEACQGTQPCELVMQGPTLVTATGAQAGICSPSGFCWENPRPVGEDLRALWTPPSTGSVGTVAKEVWAAGGAGLLMHWDGHSWASPRKDSGVPAAVSYYSLWGSSSQSLWTVGELGTILHFDGQRWQQQTSGTTEWLYGVWGSDDSHLWAVGENGTLLRYNGSLWTRESLATQMTFYAVWGSSSQDVWAVGYGDSAWHFDGSRWSSVPLPQSGLLSSLWGSSAQDLWAVGYDFAGKAGVIWHYDGARWVRYHSTPNLRLSTVWGRSPEQVFAAGEAGVLLAWNPTVGRWEEKPSGQVGWLYALLGPTASELWLAGQAGTLLRRDSTGITFDVSGPRRTFGTLWMQSSDDLWLAGEAGTVMHWDGHNLTTKPVGTLDRISGAWAASASDVWLVGDFGTVLRGDGTTFRPIPSGTTLELRSIWGSSSSDVYAVGQGGTLLHWDGTRFSSIEAGQGGFSRPLLLTHVWGRSASDVWITGEQGILLHFDGQNWRRSFTRTGETLRAIWSSSATDIWAVGDRGLVIHFNGALWEYETLAPSVANPASAPTLLSIHGRSPQDVWASGQGGTLMHWDGRRWNQESSGTTGLLSAISVDDSGSVWTVGEQGAVLHKPAPSPTTPPR